MSIDQAALRSALGQFSTGVCVVCANDSNGQLSGMTINSFASVSLEPALILWSIQNDSQCFDLFTKAENFTISVLSDQQQELSNYYATPGNQTVLAEHLNEQLTIKGAIASFHCKAYNTVAGGDHEIIIGEVEAVTQTEGKPLLFFGGAYQAIAD